MLFQLYNFYVYLSSGIFDLCLHVCSGLLYSSVLLTVSAPMSSCFATIIGSLMLLLFHFKTAITLVIFNFVKGYEPLWIVLSPVLISLFYELLFLLGILELAIFPLGSISFFFTGSQSLISHLANMLHCHWILLFSFCQREDRSVLKDYGDREGHRKWNCERRKEKYEEGRGKSGQWG